MLVKHITQEQVQEALARVNEKYAGNLRFYNLRDASTKRVPGVRFSLKVNTARMAGSRVSDPRNVYGERLGRKPRRIASACWHVHRDFYREIFKINPDARIETALARYKGSEDFERTFEETAYGCPGPFGYPIMEIGHTCNCPEGDYPEMADNIDQVASYAIGRNHIGDAV